MRSYTKGIKLVFIMATWSAAFITVSCSERQKSYKQDVSLTDPISDSRTKILIDKYNKGKEVFEEHCNTCHIAPHKKASDQYLFDNLFRRQSVGYVTKYISDSKQLKLSGDKFTMALDTVYNSSYEHSFKDSLSKLNFEDLLIYLQSATH